jgi:hypothetical protein
MNKELLQRIFDYIDWRMSVGTTYLTHPDAEEARQAKKAAFDLCENDLLPEKELKEIESKLLGMIEGEPLSSQIDRLAKVLLGEFGGPTHDEGACDTAIRKLREFKRWRDIYAKQFAENLNAAKPLREDADLGLTIGDDVVVDGIAKLIERRDHWRKRAERAEATVGCCEDPAIIRERAEAKAWRTRALTAEQENATYKRQSEKLKDALLEIGETGVGAMAFPMAKAADKLRDYLDTAHYATCNRELRAENARLREQLNDAQTNVKALTATVDNVRAEVERLREALERLRDCDWVISLPDRLDAVRAIAREALAGKEGA